MHRVLNSVTEEYHIIVFLEPWVGRIGGTPVHTSVQPEPIFGSVNHPEWQPFFPPHPFSEDNPFKTAIYVHKSRAALFTSEPSLAPSLNFTAIRSLSTPSFTLMGVYNRGPGSDASAISDLQELPLCDIDYLILTGDFNLHHHEWALANRNIAQSEAANDLFNLTSASLLSIINTPNTPTFFRSSCQSTIDLTFISADLSVNHMVEHWQAVFRRDLCSDHAYLSFSLNLEHTPDDLPLLNRPFLFDATLQSEWTAEFQARISTLNLYPLLSTEDIDAFTETLLTTYLDTSKTVFKVPSPTSPSSHRPRITWWNSKCQEAMRSLRNASSHRETNDARKHLQQVIRESRNSFFDERFMSATPDSIWHMAHWARGRRNKALPPLQVDGEWFQSPLDQARCLRNAFFSNSRPLCPTSLPSDPTPLPTQLFPPFTKEELYEVLSHTSNSSSPGKSFISYPMLKWSFEHAFPALLHLFNASLRLAHFPIPFRSTFLCVIPKPRKPDYSSPRAYRPIALLETIGKLLEKLVAKRLSDTTNHLNLVDFRQFGGRPNASVTDAALTLSNFIRKQWKDGYAVASLAVDIKGFFDNIQHHRLRQTLALLGFPAHVCDWVLSFLSNRRVSFTFAPQSEFTITNIGTPQGSPLSPILAIIYSSFAFRIIQLQPRQLMLAYVDDHLISTAVRNPDSGFTDLATLRTSLQTYFRSIGLDLDDDKDDFIIFSNRRNHRPFLREPFYRDPHRLEGRVFPNSSMRWLGIFFDARLTFKSHIEAMTNKASGTLAALRILHKSSHHGLPLILLRRLYISCVLPVLLWGSPVYFTGYRQDSLIKRMQSFQNRAIKQLMGAFRTSPSEPSHLLFAILPIKLRLKALSANAALRIARLPSSSPIFQATPSRIFDLPPTLPLRIPPRRKLKPKSPSDPFNHLISLLPRYTERLLPNLTLQISFPFHIHTFSSSHREQAVTDTKTTISNLSNSSHNLLIFTDGSYSDTQAGSAAVFVHHGQIVGEFKWGLGNKAVAFDAELYAMAFASSHIPSLIQKLHFTHIHIFSDNKSAISSILSTSPHSSQTASRLFIHNLQNAFSYSPFSLHLHWCPGHRGITFNEQADNLAKAAVSLKSPAVPATAAHFKTLLSKQLLGEWRRSWLNYATRKSLSTEAITFTPSLKPNKNLFTSTVPRILQSRVIQIILGHGHFGHYYHRFNIPEPSNCACGSPTQTRDHLLYRCRLTPPCPIRHISSIFLSPPKDHILRFTSFLKRTGAFSKEYPLCSLTRPPDMFTL